MFFILKILSSPESVDDVEDKKKELLRVMHHKVMSY